MNIDRKYRFKSNAVLTACLGLLACSAPMASSPVAEDRSPQTEALEYKYDQIAPPIRESLKSPTMLVFSKTRGWRHEEGIAGGDMHMLKLSRRLDYGVFTTENAAVFNSKDLARFKLVVLNNFTGEALSPDQKAAFQEWAEAGGGILALHGSGDSSHGDWPWYAKTIIGPTFISHPMDPQFQEARVETLAQEHPVAKGLPKSWNAVEEWYTFDSVPDENFTVIAGIDESSYSPVNNVYGDVSDLRMGEGAENHPVIWTRCMGKGRSVYSALGHLETAYDNPTYQILIENAARWVIKETDPENSGCKSEEVPRP